MSLISEILHYNKEFVETMQYQEFLTTKFPDKRMVVLTCMDTRLVELLPKAMNLQNGDAKIIKNAGAIVSHPFGSVMRSIIVAVYQLEADEIFVIGHYDCGMTGLNSADVIANAKKRGISDDVIETLGHSGIDLSRWLTGFKHVQEGIEKSVNIIRNHPLLPKNLPVHGLIIDPETGRLDLISDGYKMD
ncbi:carbonic anhydrase [Paenibacillus sp. V4I3]|uniref:beta-class carbonic anhydrase n=1 Tax=unclassified Paenibacillus TaxID=185978 RepID=UPI00277F6C7C|nr:MULTISPECIES: carbonic anhydrase [unclassified Paenibacillus]MDQ0875330.1 carbonic anhydrase [Paenibacillus sp. V4I3]MDQ0888726.1 carbonic anhydrase [Paenibacillus sp. V4I9]